MPREVRIYFSISIPLVLVTAAAEFGFISYFKAFLLFFLLLPATFWVFFRGSRFVRKWARIFVKWVDRRRPGLRDRLFRGFTKMLYHDHLFYDNGGELISRGSFSHHDQRLAALVVLVVLVGGAVEMLVSYYHLIADWMLASSVGTLPELLLDEPAEEPEGKEGVEGSDGGAVSSGPTTSNGSEGKEGVEGSDGGAVSSGPTTSNGSEGKEGGDSTWLWYVAGGITIVFIGGIALVIWQGYISTESLKGLWGQVWGCVPILKPEDVQLVVQETTQQINSVSSGVSEG